MTKIFIEREKATRHAVNAGETLVAFLTRMKSESACDEDLTWEELAIYNWATTEDDEVKRALIELVGCPQIETDADGRGKSDDTDAENTVLDPKFGLGKGILVPRAWQKKGLALEKTHKVKIRKRLPAPAISITKLSQWFIPENEECEIEFETEGVKDRADKVDFEVQATSYFERNKGGELIPSTPHTDIVRTVVMDESDTSERISSQDDWQGECEAEHGILMKKEGAEDCYINFACAPYTVLKRYYKADKDGDAKITLDAFYPCWHRATDGSGSLVLDDKSLVVKWAVKDDNSKLKVGQLIIWNKYDEAVFRAVLSETKLREEQYDLLHESVSWDKAKIFQDLMPYRVQIQAHSDMDEDNGLALAAMHTEVRAFKYDWIQFVAFDIMPGTKDDGSGKIVYLGDSDDDTDIATRCSIMKDAIEIAYLHDEIDEDTTVLKVFMAPEFYFRGAKGAYPVEKISGIVDSMRETTDRFELADWLFVFGTAIGQVAHEQVDKGVGTGQEIVHSGDIKHNARIVEVDNSGPTRIKVECGLAAGLIGHLVAWGAGQKVVDEITKCELVSESPGKNQFWLTLKSKSLFTPGPVVLLEPVAAIVDGKGVKNKWTLKVKSKICARIVKGVNWKIRQEGIEGTIVDCTHIDNDVYEIIVITTGGSWALGWIKLVEPIATEVFNIALVQKGWPAPSPCDKGLRAAIVYKEYVSHIDFLRDKTKYPGWELKDRRITIDDNEERMVLPTTGSRDVAGAESNIPGKGSTWTDKEGTKHTVGSEINKSGVGGGSVFTIDDIAFGLEVCLDHGKNKLHNFYDGKAASGDPEVQIHLIPSWGATIGDGEICCVDQGLIFNVDGSRCDSVARVNDGKWSCDDHKDVLEDSGGNCPRDVYKAPCHGFQHTSLFNCPKCSTIATLQPPHSLKQIGTAVDLLGAAADVPSSNSADYFQEAGNIKVYKVRAIPDAEFV